MAQRPMRPAGMFAFSWLSLLSAETHRKAPGSLRGLGKPLSLALSQPPFRASDLPIGSKRNRSHLGLFQSYLSHLPTLFPWPHHGFYSMPRVHRVVLVAPYELGSSFLFWQSLFFSCLNNGVWRNL